MAREAFVPAVEWLEEIPEAPEVKVPPVATICVQNTNRSAAATVSDGPVAENAVDVVSVSDADAFSMGTRAPDPVGLYAAIAAAPLLPPETENETVPDSEPLARFAHIATVPPPPDCGDGT